MTRADLTVKFRADDRGLDGELLLRPRPPIDVVRRFLKDWNFAELDEWWLRRLGVETIRVRSQVL